MVMFDALRTSKPELEFETIVVCLFQFFNLKTFKNRFDVTLYNK